MLNEVKDELITFGDSLVRQTRRNLKSEKMISSGVLYDSVGFSMDQTLTGFIFYFEMVEYGFYQDEGVQGANPGKVNVNGKRGIQKAPGSRFKFGSGKGKGSLFKGLDPWVVKKNIAPRNKKGQFMSRASLKTAMAKSIFYQGLEPRHFFSNAWDKTTKHIDNTLATAYIEDVEAIYIELIHK